MRKLLLLALLACSSTVVASVDYPDAGRFTYYGLPDTGGSRILVDNKTGCEYLAPYSGGYTLVEGTCKVQK
ncbi:hypothetical protein pEaSNUABM54_00180 [Erwinia phage pEa_SNUABM_54]|nr:hypothetical protein pEaSNUABM54_00180 [Erwinia phage pEa_SNUABM_54]